MREPFGGGGAARSPSAHTATLLRAGGHVVGYEPRPCAARATEAVERITSRQGAGKRRPRGRGTRRALGWRADAGADPAG